MNDEKSLESSEESSTSELGEAVDSKQGQLEEFVALAREASESAKTSESDARGVLSQLKQMLAEAKAELDKISEASPKFAAAATEVAINQTAVATHAQQIDEAQKRAVDIRAELDGLLTSVKQTQAEADSLKQNIDSAKASATQADADVLKVKATVEANALLVAAALGTTNTSAAKAKGLADKAASVEQKVSDYEAKLDELSAKCDEQLQAITSLLPGATSAGLASAFDKRRQTFLNPSKRWQWLFVGSVVILAIMAALSLLEVYQHTIEMTYQQLFVRWLSRIPLAAALVWLAMHASRESALAKRLEEDYGFKASVASSFQGFQEQMKIVGASAVGNEPLKTLCDATLAQITNPPGRIYEKHALIVSPTTELLKAAQAFVDAAKAAKFPLEGKVP